MNFSIFKLKLKALLRNECKALRHCFAMNLKKYSRKTIIMSKKYLLDRNVTITGDLTVNNLITVTEKVSGTAIKNLSELAGKDSKYEGDLALDYLFILEKSNHESIASQ